MSGNIDSQSNNLCITEDAFEQFQAVSMYQEEEYIILPEIVSTKPKAPDPGELSHISYDNEVVVTTENEVNSTVNDNTENVDTGTEQDTLANSTLETTVSHDDRTNNLDQDSEPQKVSRRGRKKKHVTENETDKLSNNCMMLGSLDSSTDVPVNTEQESQQIAISSTLPRKRGRKPKVKSDLPESEISQVSSNISSTLFSSDPENSDIASSGGKRKRGRPRKEPNPNDREFSSELSGSDNNRVDDLIAPRKRGRPRKARPEADSYVDSQLKQDTDIPSNELISLEDLNGTQPTNSYSKCKNNMDSDSKVFSDCGFSENDELDDITLSNLKNLPDISKPGPDSLGENDNDLNSTNKSIENFPAHKKRTSAKRGRGRPKKHNSDTLYKKEQMKAYETDHIVDTSTSNNEPNIEITQIGDDDDETDELSLSKLKEIKSDSASSENNNVAEVSTTEDNIVVEITPESSNEVNDTSTKRSSKMRVISDFEYNVDSVLDTEITEREQNTDNALLVEDTSKRPVRRRVPKLRYDEGSDEDPFANVELSDDDEPRRRKGNRYHSDDEYIPGRRGNKDIDSTDSEAENVLIDETVGKHKRKKLCKKSDNLSPRKKSTTYQTSMDVESDDVEICLKPAVISTNADSKLWGTSNNEFENFLAKKIQGTNLKIKKVSVTEPTENKALEIPVIDPEARKTFEMCSQTNIIKTESTGVQTSSPYDIPMKDNITLTPEQSKNACYFLNSIVKTTSELGTLMTQKSEDFIKKKINTTHVTDTMKMDYCVKKSFLLFKLAKHNLLQMEEDLAKQYDDFLKTNNLSACRAKQSVIMPSAKPASSDSDCEIVEEPVKSSPASKSKEKPKFNPKTVFLNKELSIKIAKKQPFDSKKLDIKGPHTVWISDTVMVKKVKATQSFLAQDSRNKKPPDNKITTKMVSDFFKNYYRQTAISVCAPFITTDWLHVGTECVCNYFVVKPDRFNSNVTYSTSDGASTEHNNSTSETNHALKQISNQTFKCPETLLKLCFRIVKSRMLDKEHVKEVCQQVQNELTDGKNQPVTLLRLCLRVMTGRAVITMERSPSPAKITTPNNVLTVLPLKALCHQRIMALLCESDKKDSTQEQKEVTKTRCSKEEFSNFIPTCSSNYLTPLIKMGNEVKSLFSLCVEFIQQKQYDSSKVGILMPKSLKSCAYEQIKQLLYKDLMIPLSETSQINNEHSDGIIIEGLTINSVNTLSEEAFLNLEQSHVDNPDSPDYLDEFDHEDSYEPEFNEIEEEIPNETNWVSQVQMQELRSCVTITNSDAVEEETVSALTQIKIEPLDDLTENVDSLAHVKVEPCPAPDEMTILPNVKPEAVEHLGPEPVHRRSSNSYDVDAFESFVTNNKIMHELHDEDIFTQSVQRVRRQHEPDYEEDDMSMSLLVPQTYEPLTIETAKGSLMESSSDEDSSRNKKVTGKKKPDKRSKGKQKKADPPKTINKEATKEKPNNEVANLTKRMKDRIRQEEKKDDSTDSESENIPLLVKRKKEQDRSTPAQTSKAKESEIQCNNVDSTDQVEENIGSFTGFTAIDQNEISTYQKYMKYVYDKIIPNKEEEISKLNNKAAEGKDDQEAPIISNEPVELLECEPTMPIFDNLINEKRPSKKSKAKVILNKDEIDKKEQIPNKEEKVLKASSFVDRHGWHCYPVNTKDVKLYQGACVALEKLPESFVQTYFVYQGITTKNLQDQEIDRLTNLSSLNRSVQLQNLVKPKLKVKRGAQGERTSEAGSRSNSPVYSDHYAELEPSDDEGANVDDEVAPPVAQRHTENTLAKDLLMNDNDSDSDDTGVKVKQEVSDDAQGLKTKSSKSKKKDSATVQDSGDLMLTADKMMNKELTLLHAPVVVEDVTDTPSKGPVTRNKQKSASKIPQPNSKVKNEEDSSSEEEKQWVSTKEKLLKRMSKKDQSSVDDAKRAKLVSEFIERRGGLPDSHMRNRSTRPRRASKRFLERQKQLGILSRELFGESSDSYMSKRSQAQASLYKGRRNIRKVIDKKSLARSTVVANMEEFERKRRLNARQTRLRELLGCEEGVNVLVINDEVCLEYDFEENRPVVTVHPFFTKVMKAHQYEGVKFMWDACFESLSEIEAGRPGGGCILAHCMGLGKTLQVLALLHTVLTHPGVNMQRVLVCCPLSTVLNWVDEIHKWIGPVTNQIKVFELSKLKKTYERAYQLEDWYSGGGIFIIGYELFRSLSTLDPILDDVRPTIVNKIRTALLDPGPDIIVCDEGHLLKNDCSVLAVAMSRVVTKRRIILTGTPMQNNLREYYCMVNFVKPNLLGTYSEYSNRFENPIMNGQHRDSREEDIKLMKARTHILHKVLEGCLQRQEASVLYPYLPKKHEYTVFITLTPCQWDLYKHYLKNYGKQSKQSILKDFHILQKIWSHPQVLHNFQTKARDRDEKNKIKAEKLEDDLANEDFEEIKPNAPEDLWWLDYLDGGNMLETLDSSNKFVVVFRILDECIALGDKVLIFSTSLFCLDALEYFLKKIKKWSLGNEYFRLDGSVPAEVRQKWCREFNADNNYKTKLFLVSTRAGCLGLNMTASNRVIIMDTSWNPAHDIQSIFRVYRFGQKKDCYIYRLVAMGTMEQKIYERSVTKQAVACRVVDEQQIDRHYNMAELTELYKFDEGGACVAGGVAPGVRDVALLRVARDVPLHAVHEHDSLLRGSAEQGLPEHERNAAWMQFQQEQAHRQIENKLSVTIPTVAIKRGNGDNAQQAAPAVDVKTEDTSDDFNPNEPKSKRGKKSTIVKCCIPIKDNKKETRGKPRKDTYIPKPSTSTQHTESETPTTYDEFKRKHSTINQEEFMVEKITDILLKYNFQGNRAKSDISTLVMKVRNVVRKGYIDEEDMSDDLTASIAKVLLPKQTSVSAATDIMCESINNSAAPDAMSSDADPDEISSDASTSFAVYTHTKKPDEFGPRTKRKAAIAAEKCIDSIAQDVVINLDDDDDDRDIRDSDFVPKKGEHSQNAATSKGKKNSKNSKPSTAVDTDESTLSADELLFSSKEKVGINVNNFKNVLKTKPTQEEKKDLSLPKPTPGRTKPKDRKIKTYKRKENSSVQSKISIVNEPVVSEPASVERDNSSSILLSDDEEPAPILTTTEKFVDNITENPVEKPLPKPSIDDEIVPLPMSLLKNQNFINIVAHTYLVGNPMLDEDAATLAAQYSTLKALKEAEETGRDVCSGPIYDIAVKVIGKEVLKKMHSVNPKAATASANDAAVSIQMKEQMIATQKTFEETAKSSKLREDMIKEKLASHHPTTPAPGPAPATPAASINSTVVPVGFVKTASYMSTSPSLTPVRIEPRVECILPDDDDLIISDVRSTPLATPTHPTPPAPPTPAVPAPTGPPKNKPIILNKLMYKRHSSMNGYEAKPIRVTVGNSNSSGLSVTQSGMPPKIILKSYKSPQPVIVSQMNTVSTSAVSAPLQVQASAPTPAVPEPRLSHDATICLDSDEEDSAAPPPPPGPGAGPGPGGAGPGRPRPVPVSLTSARGVALPLPPLPPMTPANQTLQAPAHQLILKQVVSNGMQPHYVHVLIPSDSLPIPVLPKDYAPEQPLLAPAQPQTSSANSFKAATAESLLTKKNTEPSSSHRASCKPGDIVRISKTGAIEIINQDELNIGANQTVGPNGETIETVPHLKPITLKPKPSFINLPKKTSQKMVNSASVDLTNLTTEVAQPKTTAQKSWNSASIDLTNITTQSAITKTTKSLTTTSIDLSNSSTGQSKQMVVTSKNQKKVEERKVRQMSSSSGSSSSRAASPDNPLSILKDVVHIKAVDYPGDTANTSIVLRTEKCKTSNISVEHVVAADSKKTVGRSVTTGVLKLTKVPKDKVPKYIDEAVEKQMKKDMLMKKITPLLSKNQQKTNTKPRGKNTISFDNLFSASTLIKSTASDKSTDKKNNTKTLKGMFDSKATIPKPPATVDLTNIALPGPSTKSKSDVKKRQSTSTETTPVKKKRSEPMTLKDFNLDDIDDIIELE